MQSYTDNNRHLLFNFIPFAFYSIFFLCRPEYVRVRKLGDLRKIL